MSVLDALKEGSERFEPWGSLYSAPIHYSVLV
jgi:hypothetical protein